MRWPLIAALTVFASIAAHGQTMTGSLYPSAPAGAAMTAVGTTVTGTSARTSLLGSTTPSHGITCPYVGAQWDQEGGGIYSTSATPGNITPEVTVGGQSVSFLITNIVASGNNSPWYAHITYTCTSVGASGTVRVDGYVLYYGTGSVYLVAPMKGTVTLDNRGYMPLDVLVTMAAGSTQAANAFTLQTEGFSQVH